MEGESQSYKYEEEDAVEEFDTQGIIEYLNI